MGQVEEGNHADSLNYGCMFITSDVGEACLVTRLLGSIFDAQDVRLIDERKIMVTENLSSHIKNYTQLF